MIEIFAHEGDGFKVVAEHGDRKIGMLRYNERFSKLAEYERHLLTDEAFVLLSGNATLYTDTESVEMENGKLYNIPVAIWHHIVVSEDANVLVIESKNTSKENTEKKYINI